MFTHEDIAHYEAFGFVVLRGLFSGEEAARLCAETSAELRAAYGGLGTDPGDEGGIAGDYLPLAVDRAPFAQSLIADDPRLFQGSVALLGTPTVPTAPMGRRRPEGRRRVLVDMNDAELFAGLVLTDDQRSAQV